MALTPGMIASEILLCGVRKVPLVGTAVEIVEGLHKRHEAMRNTAKLASFEAQLTRVERALRDAVEKEMRAILGNLRRPDLSGQDLTREVNELRQIQKQGWSPNLFEGLLRNSNHWQELKRNPQHYGRIVGDREKVDPNQGIHVLLDADRTRVLELTPFAFAQLLAHQPIGIPIAEVRATQDIWAFPNQQSVNSRRSEAIVEKHQWAVAGAVLANPCPAIELMATGAVQYQMISELAAVHGVDISQAQAKMIGTQMTQVLVKLGMVEAATSVIAGTLKSSLVNFASGGAVQVVSMAYLTYMSGRAFARYFEQGQTWGEGGMQRALVDQFDLNSRAEFLQGFAKEALQKVNAPIT